MACLRDKNGGHGRYEDDEGEQEADDDFSYHAVPILTIRLLILLLQPGPARLWRRGRMRRLRRVRLWRHSGVPAGGRYDPAEQGLRRVLQLRGQDNGDQPGYHCRIKKGKLVIK